MDTIKVTILDDGTIKTETDRISAANHSNAEGFLREIFKLAGGRAEKKFKHGTHNLTAGAHQHEGHFHSH